MKKFISWWMAMAIASSAVAIDFYIAIHENQHPTDEQIFVAYFVSVFFAILAFVCVGAHIEERNKSRKKSKKSQYREVIKECEKQIAEFKKEHSIS